MDHAHSPPIPQHKVACGPARDPRPVDDLSLRQCQIGAAHWPCGGPRGHPRDAVAHDGNGLIIGGPQAHRPTTEIKTWLEINVSKQLVCGG